MLVLLLFAVFSQGDKGTSWYIIWKGSVNVITHGKVNIMVAKITVRQFMAALEMPRCHGVGCFVLCDTKSSVCVCKQGLVTTLHEGEDFGQLALLNDAPRAATIILREDNCHFLRVDKQDFIRILKVCVELKTRHAFDWVVIHVCCLCHFRMLKQIQCDWRSMGKPCWCWRRVLTGPSKREQETTASEKL